jgi:hypothetical protein
MTLHNRNRLGRCVLPLLAALVPFAAVCCSAQERYIGRYDVVAGFSDISAPFVNNLNQTGINVKAGMENNRWLASGFDYSWQTGTGPLTTSLLTPALQQKLGATLPPGYVVSIPTDVTIQTITAGQQLIFRHYGRSAYFIHPVLVALRVKATPHPGDPIASAIIAQLVPSGTKVDWTGGYGVGGGTELKVSKHLGLNMNSDLAWCHPMNDLLGKGGWIYRFSVDPAFHFGKNIDTRKGR